MFEFKTVGGLADLKIRQFLGVDSLMYQSVEGLVDATGIAGKEFCLACFDERYPTPTPVDFSAPSEKVRHTDIGMEPYDHARIHAATKHE